MPAFLGEANLIRADLRGAYLHGANFQAADLTETDLRLTYLAYTNLIYANITNAKISQSNVYGINVWDLQGELKEQYDSIDTLIKALKPGIIDPAIKMHYELQLIKAKEQVIHPLQDFIGKS